MARPTVEQDSKVFIATLRELGSSAGNGALRLALGWSESRYWKIHATLFAADMIVKGRGRGGSVTLA
jgi:type I restriction enzyme M protein